jgi:thiol-disulfide isomerase/thioredoxin
MRAILTTLLIYILSIPITAQKSSLPNITVKTINNNNFNVQQLKTEPLIILSFWATWCSNCIYELDEISDEYTNWQNETKVKLVAVSIDDNRTISRVKPFLKSHQWNYLVLLDTNQEFKRYLNINAIPFTLILKKGKIIYKKTGYSPTNLSEIYSVIQHATK